MNQKLLFGGLGVLLVVIGCGAASRSETSSQVSNPKTSAAENLSCAEILARAKDATGGDAWDKVETIRQQGLLDIGGMAGTFTSLEDVHSGRFVTTFELGPVSGKEGFDGHLGWTQDQNGSVNVSESSSAVEAVTNEAFRIARAFWFDERWPAEVRCSGTEKQESGSFYVVQIVPRGGSPFDMWFNTETWLVDRIVEPQARQTSTTFFTNYREVSGILIPRTLRTNIGEEKYDVHTQIEQVNLNVESKEINFQIPEEKMNDFEIAEGKNAVVIPFDLINNHIYIQARVNGQGPLRLLVDTGGVNVLTPTAAKKLGVESEGVMAGRGAGEKTVDVSLAHVKTVAMGGVELREQVFYIIPLEHLELVEGIPLDGLVGYEVFKRFVVTVDYADRKLVLHRPDSFEEDEAGTPVPFVFDSHIPEVKGTIDGVSGTFHIDTGSRSSLTLHGPFVEEHKLVEKYRPKVEALTGWGVGGGTRGRVFRAGELVLGDMSIDGPVTDLFVGEKGAGSNKFISGNVGGGVLKRFTVTFDYQKKLMYLKKNRNFKKRGNWDRSGMWMNLDGDAFRVEDLVQGGPAERAGIRVGDRIYQIGGKNIKDLSLSETRERLRNLPPGTKVRFVLETEKSKRKVTIELRELI